MKIIEIAINKYKATISAFLFILIMGFISYNNIPKEDSPDIEIPFINVSVNHDGISPEDSEDLLIKPLEKEFSSLDNLKSIVSTGRENGASISIEFNAGTNTDKAYDDVKDAVSRAKGKLPSETDEPFVKEASTVDRPVLNIMLSGSVSESAKLKIAEYLKDEIEKLKEVLSVDIIGERKEIVEVLIEPRDLETYKVNFSELATLFSNNNRLVAAGTLDNGKGSYTFKIPGKINDLYSLSEVPVKKYNDHIIKLKDIASLKRNYEDKTSIARFNGTETIALNIKKRSGENIIETIEKVREIVDSNKNLYPKTLKIDFINDSSESIKDMLFDLENNIISSILLVFIVVVLFLGFRTGFLVSIAIPGAFLMGILLLSGLDFTVNMVVLFGLIMSIGMLVDGAIVVTEFADKKISEGFSVKESYIMASKRMAWPIISSTATTLAAFMPLMFWPGIVGEFMKYLPITIILTLTSSLIMALIFIPTIGAYFAKKRKITKKEEENIIAIENGDFKHIHGMEKLYYKILKSSLKTPYLTVFMICAISFIIVKGYIASNPKTEFFPKSEADGTTIVIKQKGDLSIKERSEYIKEVEKLIYPYFDNIESYYTNIYAKDETIAKIDLTFIDWSLRENSDNIINKLRSDFKKIEGLNIEIEEQKRGPSSGKDLQLNIYSDNKNNLYNSISLIKEKLNSLDYLIEIEDSLPINGLDWEYKIDREKITNYGISIGTISNYIKLFTSGIKLADFTPEYSSDEVDIKVRIPNSYRKIDVLNSMLINTPQGAVPMSHFVDLKQSKKIASIKRVDEKETVQIKGNIKKGYNINDKIPEIEDILKEIKIKYPDISFEFKGDQEKQKESATFLEQAFLISLGVMFIILLAQFNSLLQPLIILSAIIFSSIGVLLLLYITGMKFGIVMGGIGIIALAGIVVNNNIVLIDTFNYKINIESKDLLQSILETGVQRFRPVFLTTVTTILGLLPMALQLNIDVINGEIVHAPPSSLMWYQLSMSVVGGLSFASIITLIVTPCLLYITNRKNNKKTPH